MRRLLATALVLASLLVPGVATAAQPCTLVSPAEGAVLVAGGVYRFEATGCKPGVTGHLATQMVVESAMSVDLVTAEDGRWSQDYVVSDYTMGLRMSVWVRFADGSRTNSAHVVLAPHS
jgi:hypothetical protein